jgi:hypothetical protein
MLWNIAVNDAGAAYDPLTLLRTRTMFGRPDWKNIYSRMRQAIEAGQYLPGQTSQLRTKVGVRTSPSSDFMARADILLADLLLRPDADREGAQGGHDRGVERKRQLHLCQGALLNSPPGFRVIPLPCSHM